MFQAIDVALCPLLDVFDAVLPLQNDFVREFFEIDFIPISSPINTEEQNDGTMHHGRNYEGADRECRWRAEELTPRSFPIARRTIA